MKKTSIVLGCALLVALGGCASKGGGGEDYSELATGRDYERCQEEVAEQNLSSKDHNRMVQACLDGRGYDRYQRHR